MAHSQTAAFRQCVRDHMQAPPVVVASDLPAQQVVARMAAVRTSAAIVLDRDQRIAGILTEQDVTRRIAGRDVADRPVAAVMTRPVQTIGLDQPLYQAIGAMRRLGLRHMPVIDGAGALAGMLSLHDALAAANAGLVEHVDQLTHETTLEGLSGVKAAAVELAADLVADRVPAPEIQNLISDINNDVYRRVLTLDLDAVQDAGWGPPPVAFAVIVMGSAGRGESYLFPDQDNGFILADYPDAEHPRIDAFFIELAERMNQQLDGLGFPRCRGGVMAINPVWRKSIGQWRQQVSRWIARPTDVALQLADVLFDFQSVFGEMGLADELRRFILGLCHAHPGFLRQMFGLHAERRAALGWFGRLLLERDDPAHQGHLNLKYAGTLPLAEAVRLLALRAGIEVTGTLARIDALGQAGELSRDLQDDLRAAFDQITGLQLRQQIADYEAGRPVSNFVDPASLTARETELLKGSFRAINGFRARVRAELDSDVF
jgi:CBS domain-containing protein